MADVHISHADEDRGRAESIGEVLTALGFDNSKNGPDAAKALLVLWSEHSARSEPVRAQARDAAATETLVSVRIDECRLPLEFRLIHTEYLEEGAERGDDPVWLSILGRIGELAGKPHKA
jgi:hypothetical protein